MEAWPPQRPAREGLSLRAASWAHPQKVSCSGRSGACPGLCIFQNSTGDSRAGGLHPQSQSPVCFLPHRSILLILEAPRVCGQDLFPLLVSAPCFLDTPDGGEEKEPGDPGSRSRKAGCVSLVGPRGSQKAGCQRPRPPPVLHFLPERDGPPSHRFVTSPIACFLLIHLQTEGRRLPCKISLIILLRARLRRPQREMPSESLPQAFWGWQRCFRPQTHVAGQSTGREWQ